METLEHAIRERAYHLWLAEGRRDGAADAHWLAAEREVLAGALSAQAAPAKAAKRAPAKPRARKRAA
jgi:hypothetical protein